MRTTENTKRYALRALAGTTVITAAALGVITASLIQPQYPITTPEAIAVDVTSNTTHSVACAGALPLIGADPHNPSAATPQGDLTFMSTTQNVQELVWTPEQTQGAGAAFTAASSTRLAAAGTQEFQTDNLSGLVATACSTPSTDLWLVGGATTLGNTATVIVANPGGNAATVQITAYTEAGEVTAGTTAGAVVPAGQVRAIAVNGIAPAANELALHLEARGAAVAAALALSEIHDIRPFCADLISSQQPGETRLVFPTVRSEIEQQNSDAHSSASHELVLLAPENSGTASINLLTDGAKSTLQTVELTAGKATRVTLTDWVNGAALEVVADTQIVGAASGRSLQEGKTDMVWFTPAPAFVNGTAAIVPGGELHLINPNGQQLSLTVRDAHNSGTKNTVTLAPFSTHTLQNLPEAVFLDADAEIHSSVTIFNKGGAAAYPISGDITPKSQILIYTD